MAGMLDSLRSNVISTVWKSEADRKAVVDIDDKIALGVLLWIVAEADEKFLPEEEKKIKEVLVSYGNIKDDELSTIMVSVQKAAERRIDLYQFTNEVSENLPYKHKISIIENLFRVACADKDLDENEIELIRKISGLFLIAHKDFIDIKIKIKKEFGLKTL